MGTAGWLWNCRACRRDGFRESHSAPRAENENNTHSLNRWRGAPCLFIQLCARPVPLRGRRDQRPSPRRSFKGACQIHRTAGCFPGCPNSRKPESRFSKTKWPGPVSDDLAQQSRFRLFRAIGAHIYGDRGGQATQFAVNSMAAPEPAPISVPVDPQLLLRDRRVRLNCSPSLFGNTFLAMPKRCS